MTPFYYAHEMKRSYDSGKPSYIVHVKLAVEGQVHLKNPIVFTTEGQRTCDLAWNDAYEWAVDLGLEVVRPEDLAERAKLPRGEE